jgi:hypothetical protein
MRLAFLTVLHGLCSIATASPLWVPMPFTKGIEIDPNLKCYRKGLAYSSETLEKAVDLACEVFSGYIWGDGGWATQLENPYWDMSGDCGLCSRYPIIVKVDYVGGDQCAPPMKLSKDDCKRMISPIIDTW